MEIESSLGNKYCCGNMLEEEHGIKVNDIEFEVEPGFKIIAFAGVMEVSNNDCKFLNLSITNKPLNEDCKTGA
jgi:hypothetical protein